MTDPTTPKRDPTPEEEAESLRLQEVTKANTAKMFAEDGMHLRTEVLHAALHIEDRIELLLVELLGLSDRSSIKVPFERKIKLITAIGSVDDNGKDLLNLFREVRNRFIHDKDVNTFVKCYADLGKKRRDLILSYAQAEVDARPYKVDNVNEEELLHLGTKILFTHVGTICTKAQEFALERRMSDVFGEIFARVFARYREQIDHPFGEMVKRVSTDPKQTYTKADQFQLIEDLFSAVREFILKAAREERDRYFIEKGFPLPEDADQADPPTGQRT